MRSARCWSLGTWSWTRSRTCARSRCPARSRAPGRRAWGRARAAGSPGCGSAGSWARRPAGSPGAGWRPAAVVARDPGAGATATARVPRAASRPPRPWAPCRTAAFAPRAKTAVRPARGRPQRWRRTAAWAAVGRAAARTTRTNCGVCWRWSRIKAPSSSSRQSSCRAGCWTTRGCGAGGDRSSAGAAAWTTCCSGRRCCSGRTWRTTIATTTCSAPTWPTWNASGTRCLTGLPRWRRRACRMRRRYTGCWSSSSRSSARTGSSKNGCAAAVWAPSRRRPRRAPRRNLLVTMAAGLLPFSPSRRPPGPAPRRPAATRTTRPANTLRATCRPSSCSASSVRPRPRPRHRRPRRCRPRRRTTTCCSIVTTTTTTTITTTGPGACCWSGRPTRSPGTSRVAQPHRRSRCRRPWTSGRRRSPSG